MYTYIHIYVQYTYIYMCIYKYIHISNYLIIFYLISQANVACGGYVLRAPPQTKTSFKP